MKHAELTNVVGGTQASETIKNKSRPTPIVINEDPDHEDSDDYDPESSSSEDESDVDFHDSDYNLSDDDNLVETIPERNVQSEGMKLSNKPEIDQNYKETLEKLANIDGDSDSGSTYLSSGYSSSDEEGGSSKRIRKKYKLFNEQTDMDNPQFLVGMEFKLVEKMKGHVGEWVTTYTGNNKYEVSGPGRQYRVDLEHKICGCRRWDLNGIPCIHAVAAYSLFDQEPLDHVHQCYSKATYLKTYDNMLAPLNGKELWTTSLTQVMLPPDVCRRAGRPKKARRREPEEEATVPPDPTKLGRKGTKMTCSKCGVQGHNKRSCKTKEPVREQSAPVDEMAEQSAHGTSGVVQERANAAMGSGIKLPKTKPKRASKLTVRRQMNKTKHNQVEQNKGLTLSQPQSQVDDPVPS